MKKRLLTLFFSLCMIITVLPIIALAANETPTTGTCGDGVTWTYTPDLDEDGYDLGGTLVISGDGAMENYSYNDSPWYEFRRKIKELQIENGVTSIGNSAFSGCGGLTSVTIPDSVTSIGSSAFSGCDGLTNVTIPASVTSIGSSAFSNCDGLTSVTIPGSVNIIGESAFSDCEKLSEVSISNGVRTIGNWAFSGCTSLSDIFIPESVYRIADAYFAALSGCDSLTMIEVDQKNTN